MKEPFKPAMLIPSLIGMVVGTLLFIFGYLDDAPGMCAVGLSLVFVLVMWGITKTGIIRKCFFVPTLLFCFGMGGIFLSVVLLLDGEFENMPGLAFVGGVLGIVLIFSGFFGFGKQNGNSRLS